MAGHSKWSNIKHRKAKADAQKGKVYTKFSKLIIIAAKEGGADPNNNFKLKDLIDKAKAANMPNDNILRAIKRGSGELGGADFEEIIYEGYGPCGVAIMVDAATDNRNRTAGDMRHLFDKNGGNLGETGGVAWMFDKKGLIVVEKSDDIDIDDLMLLAIDAGADDVEEEEDIIEIVTEVEHLEIVKKALQEADIELLSAEIAYLPKTMTSVSGDDSEKVERLLEVLEDHDDVQNVYTNYEPADDEG